MNETITLTLPRLYVEQVLVVLCELQLVLGCRHTRNLTRHLTAKESLDMIEYYQQIIDAIAQQYS